MGWLVRRCNVTQYVRRRDASLRRECWEMNARSKAREAGFIQRERNFSGADFVQIMAFGHLAHPQSTLDQLTQMAQLREVHQSFRVTATFLQAIARKYCAAYHVHKTGVVRVSCLCLYFINKSKKLWSMPIGSPLPKRTPQSGYISRALSPSRRFFDRCRGFTRIRHPGFDIPTCINKANKILNYSMLINLLIKWTVKRAIAYKAFARNEWLLSHSASLRILYWLLARPFNCQNF